VETLGHGIGKRCEDGLLGQRKADQGDEVGETVNGAAWGAGGSLTLSLYSEERERRLPCWFQAGRRQGGSRLSRFTEEEATLATRHRWLA
jgi:hypothetical protein